MLKRSIRILMLQTAPLYEPITDLLNRLYNHTPHPAILDLAKNLLILFAHSDEFTHVSKVLFGTLCARTLRMFEDGTIMEHPDILEGFMAYLSQVRKSIVCFSIELRYYAVYYMLYGMIVILSYGDGETHCCSVT